LYDDGELEAESHPLRCEPTVGPGDTIRFRIPSLRFATSEEDDDDQYDEAEHARHAKPELHGYDSDSGFIVSDGTPTSADDEDAEETEFEFEDDSDSDYEASTDSEEESDDEYQLSTDSDASQGCK